MKIFISGIGGFLGSRMAQYWAAAGHTVAGSTREEASVKALTTASRDGVDVMVHAAYDRKGGVERNIAEGKTACLAAERAGAAYQIFISSYAARADTRAEYGQMKYRLEEFFLERGHGVVRPGLVIGNGGMFGRNLKQILRAPVIPLLDGGRDLIAVIAIEDFVSSMDRLAANCSRGAFNLFNRELVPMRRLVETINRFAGRKPMLLNVPLNAALVFLTVAEKLRIPFPAGADNVRSLKQSLPHIYESDLEALIGRTKSFEAMIESAVRNCR